MFPGTLSSLPTAKVSLRLLLLPVMLLGRRPTTTRRRVWMKEVSDIVWASAVPAMAAALGLNKDSSKPLKRQVSAVLFLVGDIVAK